MDNNIKWRPIETAPKDGELIIVYYNVADTDFVHAAFYRNQKDYDCHGQYCGFNNLEEWEGWWSYIRNSVSQEKLDGPRTPTHWIPFPD